MAAAPPASQDLTGGGKDSIFGHHQIRPQGPDGQAAGAAPTHSLRTRGRPLNRRLAISCSGEIVTELDSGMGLQAWEGTGL